MVSTKKSKREGTAIGVKTPILYEGLISLGLLFWEPVKNRGFTPGKKEVGKYMDPHEFYHRAERLHDDEGCANCPAALKRRCDNLPGDDHDLCSLIVYAKFDMEDNTEQSVVIIEGD